MIHRCDGAPPPNDAEHVAASSPGSRRRLPGRYLHAAAAHAPAPACVRAWMPIHLTRTTPPHVGGVAGRAPVPAVSACGGCRNIDTAYSYSPIDSKVEVASSHVRPRDLASIIIVRILLCPSDGD